MVLNFFEFEKELKKLKIEYEKNVCMKNHTTFKIGGNADYLAYVYSKEELKTVIGLANQNEVPFIVVGKGSNLLISDLGIEGLVISLSKMDKIEVSEDEIIAEAGANLSALCIKAMENELEGLEFAYGIPGSVGGALYMNAGAYGGEMSQVVLSAEYIDFNGDFGEISINDMQLGYRTSVFKTNKKIITSVKFKLKKGEKTKIKETMSDLLNRRKEKQPLEFPSAGSTFKRPTGYFAGALIEECNLKGFSCGGAKVSEKHAGFVINYNNASCNDVLNLVKNIKETVKKEKNVELETEIIFIGRKQ